MPDGGADDGEEPGGVTDHGSKFGYYDGIYHEPAGIRVICKGMMARSNEAVSMTVFEEKPWNRSGEDL